MLKTLETSTKAACFTYKYLYVFPWDFVMISPWCDFEMISDKISPIVKVAVTVNKRFV